MTKRKLALYSADALAKWRKIVRESITNTNSTRTELIIGWFGLVVVLCVSVGCFVYRSRSVCVCQFCVIVEANGRSMSMGSRAKEYSESWNSALTSFYLRSCTGISGDYDGNISYINRTLFTVFTTVSRTHCLCDGKNSDEKPSRMLNQFSLLFHQSILWIRKYPIDRISVCSHSIYIPGENKNKITAACSNNTSVLNSYFSLCCCDWLNKPKIALYTPNEEQ